MDSTVVRRVLVVGFPPPALEIVRRTLARESLHGIPLEEAAPAELAALIKYHTPALVLLAAGASSTAACAAVRSATAFLPAPPVLVALRTAQEPLQRSLLEAGATALLCLDELGAWLPAAVRASLEGKSFLAPAVVQGVIAGYLRQPCLPPPVAERGGFPVLSPREAAVAAAISRGLRTREIAAHLGVSAKTIDKHRANVLRKLGLRNAAELGAHMARRGLAEAT